DEHFVAGWGLAEDAEPREGVLVEVPLPSGLGDHRPTGSAGAVGADDVSGADAQLLAVDGGGGHPGAFGLDIAEAGVGDRVVDRLSGAFAGGGEVDEDLVLRVEPDGFADEFGEVEGVGGPVDAD